jgi:chemotaxis protein MotB
MSGGTPDRFRDPFSTIKSLAEVSSTIGVKAEVTMPEKYGGGTAGSLSIPNISTLNTEKLSPDSSINNAAQSSSTGSKQSEAEAQGNSNEAVKLALEISNELNSDVVNKTMPHIEVKSTSEGILISLTDDADFSMFAIGSAEPQVRTIQVMAKIAEILKARVGSIVIRGYTDGRPYKSPIYDNWRLSSARAHMAQYMLIRGGMEEKRIEKIEGYADRHLKNPVNPEATENRRIEILLRKEKA